MENYSIFDNSENKSNHAALTAWVLTAYQKDIPENFEYCYFQKYE